MTDPYQAGGPETEGNGLAPCVLHHETFDLGAFTVSGGILLVSDRANGTAGFKETLMAYRGSRSGSRSTPTGSRRHAISNGTGGKCPRARRDIAIEESIAGFMPGDWSRDGPEDRPPWSRGSRP